MKNLLNKMNIKKKGALNATEIGVILAIILLVGYPLFKGIVSTSFSTIQTWVSASLGKIFTAVS